jgi:hypothetical protein
MATQYHIQEQTNGLRIQARQEMERWERLVLAVGVAMMVGIAAANFLGGQWWIILSAITAVGIFQAVRSKDAELQVTNVEFTTKGDLGRRARTPRIVCAGDIHRLEFGGPFGPLVTRPSGLYASTSRTRVCVLPFLDFRQTADVIRAIEQKFPGLAEGWHARSGDARRE